MPATATKARELGTARSYDELQDILRARIDDLDVSRHTVDHIAGLPMGHTGRLLGPRQTKRIGHISLGALLGALGLALVVVEDLEALDRVRSRLVKRQSQQTRPKNASGSPEQPPSPVEEKLQATT